MKFEELSLHESILKSLKDQNFITPTPIQEEIIPHALEGKDVSGLAQTGTGKTAAFLIPLIHRLLVSRDLLKNPVEGDLPKAVFKDLKENHFMLILVPTRELADQVLEGFKGLAKYTDLKATSVYGGMDLEPQKRKIREGVDFLIATPGRLIDLYKSHSVDLKQVRAIVFDEADRMFDMGFKDDMKYLLQRIPKDRQFLVFSATLNFDVLTVAYQNGANPIECHVDRDQPTAENVDHFLYHVGSNEKPAYLLSLLKKLKPKQTIIFSNFKHNVEKIVNFLNSNSIPAMGISSLLGQGQRNKVMSQFKSENSQNVLVATDVAARGLDVKGVDLIINFELPDDAENYVHRIGRTGRAGEKGRAYSLVSDMDIASLSRIESYLKDKVAVEWLEDDEILKDFSPFPTFSRRKDFRSDRGGDNRRRDSRGSDNRRSDSRRDGKKRGSYAKDGSRDKRDDNFKRDDRKHGDSKKGSKPHHKSKYNGKTSSSKKPYDKSMPYKARTKSPVKKVESGLTKFLNKLAFWK